MFSVSSINRLSIQIDRIIPTQPTTHTNKNDTPFKRAVFILTNKPTIQHAPTRLLLNLTRPRPASLLALAAISLKLQTCHSEGR